MLEPIYTHPTAVDRRTYLAARTVMIAAVLMSIHARNAACFCCSRVTHSSGGDLAPAALAGVLDGSFYIVMCRKFHLRGLVGMLLRASRNVGKSIYVLRPRTAKRCSRPTNMRYTIGVLQRTLDEDVFQYLL